ncbi:dihydrofolate synthase/folylpolyglutamate synthase [Agromyces flavus]|uniref:tetrahydrofolate synthase n=1 Tax=Agromyces flavus TaxID=589382 RepID=A0A1H1R6V1_9MICO|nr:folylpolyglutamate synthase/dihydrofolate synthase family protein [Agromyces flavus]MCP2367610.1 dihydrofolate synthase/folylpolyglutamate synthase [Agromyces flavus]GGI47041.1 dihydrofolate synthase [Agromyces flavus]SDS31266.1 dihydrofolate synthase / folylpolyglutamate synthase [Agromyces flavus]
MTDAIPDATPEERDAADAVYAALLARVGEAAPQPRLDATRRAVELLGDPHRAAPVIHLTGTNGKTSTSRMIESILRAEGLRTGLLTSPHLVRFTERIRIDGEPITDEAVARIWDEIEPFIGLVDAELSDRGEEPLTFFEALTVLAFAAFADAPVDVVVLEVGMGGEWDSTNVADGQVAVFTPIALDHESRLGRTVAEIARTKAGIIKPGAAVVTAFQAPEALGVLHEVAAANDATVAIEGGGFAVLDSRVAVGGQLVGIRGLAGEYRDVALPLYGRHQAENAAVAVAAVESFLGGGAVRLADDVLEEGLGAVTSPGRLHPISTEPTVLVDAAHNPHGAAALVEALGEYFDFDEVLYVFGVLADKDAAGIVRALDSGGARFLVTQSESDRAVPATELAPSVAALVGADRVDVADRLDDALDEARDWATRGEKRGVVVTGSITLVGDAIAIAEDREWGAR